MEVGKWQRWSPLTAFNISSSQQIFSVLQIATLLLTKPRHVFMGLAWVASCRSPKAVQAFISQLNVANNFFGQVTGADGTNYWLNTSQVTSISNAHPGAAAGTNSAVFAGGAKLVHYRNSSRRRFTAWANLKRRTQQAFSHASDFT
jgi:hypothetical protein